MKCPQCGEEKSNIMDRYSFGIYAGKFCDDCCYGFVDHCGIDQRQGTPEEFEAMGETYWED